FIDGGQFPKGHPQSDDMEGRDVWDPSVPETLQECTWRLNNIRHRRIAVLTGEADRELEATARAAAEAIALAEAAKLGELSPDDGEDDILWQDETIWLEGYHIPMINARPPIPQPLLRFIPGHGFAQYPLHPALRAHAPPFLAPLRRAPPRPVCSFERPKNVSPLEMVLSKGFFLQCFPEIVTEALVNEFGRPPYLQYIAQHLPPNFLMLPTGSEPVPAVEPTPLSEPEPQESTVEIEWEPIGFSRSAR
ncbi:MAG: hypothetical protein GY835_01445, partial [bacterium]|nr:hypothetical protein [bacterium]